MSFYRRHKTDRRIASRADREGRGPRTGDRPRSGRAFSAILLLPVLLLVCHSLYGQDDSLATEPLPSDSTTTTIESGKNDSILLSELDSFVDSVFGSGYRYDSSEVIIRPFDSTEMQSFREDDDFDYLRTQDDTSRSIFEWLFGWIGKLMSTLFGNKTTSEAIIYILFALALGLVIYFILKGQGSGFLFLKGAKKKEGLVFEEVIEDIHELDFDRLIADAESKKLFGLGIRYHYLKSLRTMTEKGMIDWRKEKTNIDYVREFNQDDLRPRFSELTRLFEYVWYGGFELSQDHYHDLKGRFTEFIGRVEERRSV